MEPIVRKQGIRRALDATAVGQRWLSLVADASGPSGGGAPLLRRAMTRLGLSGVIVFCVLLSVGATVADAKIRLGVTPFRVSPGGQVSIRLSGSRRPCQLTMSSDGRVAWRRDVRSGDYHVAIGTGAAAGIRVVRARCGHQTRAQYFSVVARSQGTPTSSGSGGGTAGGTGSSSGSGGSSGTGTPSPDLGSQLASGQTLSVGQYLMSPNGQYQLIMQTDGNLVLYRGSTALWSSGTGGDDGATVTMQTDGNLVLYLNGVAKWNSNTAGFSGDFLQLQDDSNLVIYQGAHALWDWGSGYIGNQLFGGTTLTAGEELISPGRAYDLIMQGDGNLVLYQGSTALWSSGTSGDDGATVTMQTDGNLVVYLNGVAEWNSNTAGFSGDFLQLQDDSNLVIYQGAHALWDWGSGYLGNRLTAGITLTPSEELISPGHGYDLIMQGDGNLVLYQGSTALWSSGTDGDSGATVTMQTDGNLVVYDGEIAKWNSNTAGFSGDFLQLQDDSNLVIYQGSTAIWDWGSGRLGGGPSGGGPGQAIVNAAASQTGVTYCWDGGNQSGPTHGDGDLDGEAPDCGGSTTVGFDCSGLVLYAVYQATGVALPHNAAAQGANYAEYGGTIVSSQSSLEPGDLVFFGGGSMANAQHVGIYIGGGEMWDANTAWGPYSDGVQERSLSETEGGSAGLPFDGGVRFG
jgi:cell wall-associated NlpC family hydrolase